MGSWQDQRISTYRKIHEAIDAGEWDLAAQLANYFVEEASVCCGIYRQWIPDLNAFLAENGVSKEDIAAANERIVATLAFPDGSPWNVRTQWFKVHEQCEQLVGHVFREEAEAAHAKLDELQGDVAPVPRPRRRPHLRPDERDRGTPGRAGDRATCGTSVLLPAVLVALREVRHRQAPVGRRPRDADARRLRGDARPPRRAGADRRLRADRDWRTGTSSASTRAGRAAGRSGATRSRARRPAWSRRTTGRSPRSRTPGTTAHPGVCHYCTHCIVLMEEMPIDRFGYPVRVIDPPS